MWGEKKERGRKKERKKGFRPINLSVVFEKNRNAQETSPFYEMKSMQKCGSSKSESEVLSRPHCAVPKSDIK